MGADIHAYVEYELFSTEQGPYWANLTSNFGSRNYYLFGLLAEVRGDGPALFKPRGIPEGRLGWETSDAYWTRVSDKYADHDGFTSNENAERWVREGYSVAEKNEDGSLIRVSGPDWHSHSWLTAEELGKVLDHYAANVQSVWVDQKPEAPVEWRALLAAMREFENAGKAVRVVFWFDN